MPGRAVHRDEESLMREGVAETVADRSAVEPAAAIMRHFVAQPGFLLARIDQICTAIYREIAGEETLAQAELLLLLALLELPDQITLARAAGVDRSTTALILTNLEGRRLVARESHP